MEAAMARMDENTREGTEGTQESLPAAARRALAEAAERRRLAEAAAAAAPPKPAEFEGPAGPEPVRYGDWERSGRASDF